mmetsp:Transcript_133769/g.198918  ORF Transcript_133769/g.198918 Transcript_133769/m.198918 type:complete len:531 (-) Transcript_133769:30-1622(-)|eukprot:CAMPEP_0117024204 /NCGR_PEP_ID=MMETSP0472-20121206/17997_1 /TAXON_ID=693140 ORGANISM="Tiarina fusus, Strain LIS" /NCGR_SAMPLE_ID=MMETSP0472 /ASSEMBLY_ACC=CAM_ASM_000603 /LENGTH=530 /DNA_ID=CAMNT_0004730565 /DNA_START=17 /DNA_END=1609 /DNA_ORIENTATION=+
MGNSSSSSTPAEKPPAEVIDNLSEQASKEPCFQLTRSDSGDSFLCDSDLSASLHDDEYYFVRCNDSVSNLGNSSILSADSEDFDSDDWCIVQCPKTEPNEDGQQKRTVKIVDTTTNSSWWETLSSFSFSTSTPPTSPTTEGNTAREQELQQQIKDLQIQIRLLNLKWDHVTSSSFPQSPVASRIITISPNGKGESPISTGLPVSPLSATPNAQFSVVSSPIPNFPANAQVQQNGILVHPSVPSPAINQQNENSVNPTIPTDPPLINPKSTAENTTQIPNATPSIPDTSSSTVNTVNSQPQPEVSPAPVAPPPTAVPPPPPANIPPPPPIEGMNPEARKKKAAKKKEVSPSDVEKLLYELIQASTISPSNYKIAFDNFLKVFSFPDAHKVLNKMLTDYHFLVKEYPLDPSRCFKIMLRWEKDLFSTLSPEDCKMYRKSQWVQITKLEIEDEIVAQFKWIKNDVLVRKKKEEDLKKMKETGAQQNSVIDEMKRLHDAQKKEEDASQMQKELENLTTASIDLNESQFLLSMCE